MSLLLLTDKSLCDLSRYQLYSMVNALRREVQCLTNDLLRYQLLTKKLQKYQQLIDSIDETIDKNLVKNQINSLIVTKSCSVSLKSLNSTKNCNQLNDIKSIGCQTSVKLLLNQWTQTDDKLRNTNEVNNEEIEDIDCKISCQSMDETIEERVDENNDNNSCNRNEMKSNEEKSSNLQILTNNILNKRLTIDDNDLVINNNDQTVVNDNKTTDKDIIDECFVNDVNVDDMNQLKTTNRDESQCENVEQLMDQSIASYSLRNQPTISYTVNSNLGENTNDSDSDNTVFDDYIQDLDQSEDDNCMDQMYIKSEIVINSEDNDNCNELLETEMKSLGSKNKTKFNKTDRKKTKTSIKKKLPKKTVKCRNCLSDGIDECRHQYRCRINGCNKLFESAKECNDHTESIHSETIRFRCDVDPCRQTFVLKVNYDRHIRDDHQREPKYNEFVKEIIDVSGDKKYQCHWDGCERLPYKHRESCVHHICDQHLLPPRDYRCDWLGCGKVYKTNHDLRYHQTEHENKSYQCQQCPAIFASEQRLKRHIERHGSTYQCKHINCQFQSGNLGKYNRHLLNVHNKTNQQLRCDIDECTKIYHIAGDLNRHQLLRHPDHYPDIPWKSCTQSNCTFQSKCNSYLTQHIKNHSRIFECTIGGCDKLFTTSYNLNQHYRMVHPDYMPDQPWLKCPVDGCKYTSKSDKNLSIHSKTHTKPFKCDICDKRFAARNRLKDHQSEHNGTVKRYRCEWPGCSATLKEKDKLKYHMERHTRDKTYRCEWPGCERTYNLKGSLRVQVDRDHRGIGGYRCQWPGCDYKSTNTIRWKNHLKIHDG